MSTSFKYKSITRPGLPQLRCPVIPIKIIGPKEAFSTLGLLDSGADVSAMPMEIAEILGLDLNGEKEKVRGVGGPVDSVKRVINVMIEFDHQRKSIPLEARVILDRENAFPFLLGRDFFLQFEITFKERDKKVIMKQVGGREQGV